MMRTNPIILLAFGLCLALPESGAAQSMPKPIKRSVATLGVRGTVTVTQFTPEHVEIHYKTKAGETRDTLRAKGLNQQIVNGRKAPFYLGRFGSSTHPMLIVSLRDPDRIQDSRTISYQLSSGGGLIGQRVVVDGTLAPQYTETTSGGRHYLSAIDTRLGTIYSLAYQRATFAGYYITYEKLRVRQWETSLDAFIETDQGFLRDRFGRIMESGRFNMLSEPARQQIFVANVMPPRQSTKPAVRKPVQARVIPASAPRAGLK